MKYEAKPKKKNGYWTVLVLNRKCEYCDGIEIVSCLLLL